MNIGEQLGKRRYNRARGGLRAVGGGGGEGGGWGVGCHARIQKVLSDGSNFDNFF